MRNLSLCTSSVTHLPDANVAATAIDIEQNTLYIASEATSLDGQVEVALWKVGSDDGADVRRNSFVE